MNTNKQPTPASRRSGKQLIDFLRWVAAGGFRLGLRSTLLWIAPRLTRQLRILGEHSVPAQAVDHSDSCSGYCEQNSAHRMYRNEHFRIRLVDASWTARM